MRAHLMFFRKLNASIVLRLVVQKLAQLCKTKPGLGFFDEGIAIRFLDVSHSFGHGVVDLLARPDLVTLVVDSASPEEH